MTDLAVYILAAIGLVRVVQWAVTYIRRSMDHRECERIGDRARVSLERYRELDQEQSWSDDSHKEWRRRDR